MFALPVAEHLPGGGTPLVCGRAEGLSGSRDSRPNCAANLKSFASDLDAPARRPPSSRIIFTVEAQFVVRCHNVKPDRATMGSHCLHRAANRLIPILVRQSRRVGSLDADPSHTVKRP